jgi:hypothetical protein
MFVTAQFRPLRQMLDTREKIPNPAHQRYHRLYSMCAISYRSERMVNNTWSSDARSNHSGGIEGQPFLE